MLLGLASASASVLIRSAFALPTTKRSAGPTRTSQALDAGLSGVACAASSCSVP